MDGSSVSAFAATPLTRAGSAFKSNGNGRRLRFDTNGGKQSNRNIVIIIIMLAMALLFLVFSFNLHQRFANLQAYSSHQLSSVLVDRLSGMATAASSKPSTKVHVVRDAEHCALTTSEWCEQYLQQTQIPWLPPPIYNNSCPVGCNRVGVCDYKLGVCRCEAGWKGENCDERNRRPCSDDHRPYGLWEPNQEPSKMIADKSWMMSACVGYCDEDVGLCFCPPDAKYGRKPLPIDRPPGTHLKLDEFGRSMHYGCQPDALEDGTRLRGQRPRAQVLDWCNADLPKTLCNCNHDNFGGLLCNVPQEAYCTNQCSGHGECWMGFCRCDAGYWGHDCSYRTAGTPTWTSGREANNSWLQHTVYTPSAMDKPPKPNRKRPLIYVYELPPIFNSHMLQYRLNLEDCVYRRYFADGITNNLGHTLFTYSLESAFHEMLLQSEHRTLDAENADFYFIPIYISCFMSSVYGNADTPLFHGQMIPNRVGQAAFMLIEAFQWVRTHHPFWSRHNGKDHIILLTHDEASCYVPTVLRNATIISHWGYLNTNEKAYSNYDPDLFDVDLNDTVYLPEGYLTYIGHPHQKCYDKEKDLIVPSLWPPHHRSDSPFYGAPTQPRTILGYHSGRLLTWRPHYSRGTRQRMANLTITNNWWENHRIWVGEGVFPDKTYEEYSYSKMLASSVFCFVLQGDGWTSRFEDAITNGCIPAIMIQDTHMPFETLLDSTQFSIRINVSDMERVPDILKAVSAERIAELQKNIAKIWRRFDYTSNRWYSSIIRDEFWSDRNESVVNEAPKSLPSSQFGWNPEEGDAFETIMSWLYSRIDAVKS